MRHCETISDMKQNEGIVFVHYITCNHIYVPKKNRCRVVVILTSQGLNSQIQ